MRLSSIKHVCFENIRQRSSLTVIYSVLLSVIMPVLVLLNKTAVKGTQNEFLARITVLLVLYSLTVMTFTFISAVSAFSYMHKKRSVDFYGSLPVSRREEFFGRAAAIWIIMNVPMLIIAIAGGLIAMDTDAFFLILYFSLRLIVSVSASIIFTGFLAVCSGTVASTVMNYILINAIYPIFTLIVLGMPEMLPGYVSEFKNAIVLSVFSPYLSPFFMIDANLPQIIWILSIMVIVSAGLTVATYHLINRRKAECAQSKAAFPVPSIAIRFMTSFTAGYLGAFVFYAMFRINYMLFGGVTSEEDKMTSLAALGIFILGFTLFSFVAHFILHLIYNRGLKGLVKSLILYGSQLAFCFVTLGIIVSGAFGYVGRVPDMRDVDNINIEYSDSYSELVYNGEKLTSLKITDRNEIKKIRKIHKDIIDEVEDENNNIYMSLFTAMFEDLYNNCKIQYRLKDGSTLAREYSTDKFDYLSKEYSYMINKNILDKVDPSDFDDVTIYFEDGNFRLDDDKEAVIEFIKTFKSDYERVGIPEEKTNNEIANEIEEGYYSDFDYSLEFTIDNYHAYFTFNNSYTETMKLLNSERFMKYKDNY